MIQLDLSSDQRTQVLEFLQEELEEYYEHTANLRVSPELDQSVIRGFVRQHDFAKALAPKTALLHVLKGLTRYAVHTPHPKYFGLFNPRANFAGILADFITATYNPQMAAWSHSPFAAEVETYLTQAFGERFGYASDRIDGVFAAGGAEANLTAVLCALNRHFPGFANDGLVGMSKKPRIYCSAEAHHSIVKAARTAGLGYHAVANIEVGGDLRMDVEALKAQITLDRQNGLQAFMLVGTAGTTGAGSIDELEKLAQVAQDHDLWFHVDAAYGGAAILHPELKGFLEGIERSQSITFDAHKWLSVPMATSLFITSDPEILDITFRTTTEYMPKDAGSLQIVDPFTHSIQWSRRFIGLKLYLSLLFYGWKGYAEVIGHQTRVGQKLKEALMASGWSVLNSSPFPILCFTDPQLAEDPNFAHAIAQAVVRSGKSWVSVYPVHGKPTIRACITNYATQEEDVLALVEELNRERALFASKPVK